MKKSNANGVGDSYYGSTTSSVIASDSPILDHRTSSDMQQATSVFVGKDGQPKCTLLILGNFDGADIGSKNSYTETLNLKNISDGARCPKYRTEQNDNLTLVIWDISSYDKVSAFAQYSTATMIAIIPNSARDLRMCYNSVFHQQHQPAQGSVVSYLNLFDDGSNEYADIESEAVKLGFVGNKLENTAIPTVNDLLEHAIQHTRDTIKRVKSAEVQNGSDQNRLDKSGPNQNSSPACTML